MCLGELLFGESGIALQQQGTESVSPEQVNDLFVGQNGIRGRAAAAHEQNEKKSHPSDQQQAPTSGHGTPLNERSTVQMRPRSTRTTTMRMITPTPPVGA